MLRKREKVSFMYDVTLYSRGRWKICDVPMLIMKLSRQEKHDASFVGRKFCFVFDVIYEWPQIK